MGRGISCRHRIAVERLAEHILVWLEAPSETIAKIRINFGPPGSLPANPRTKRASKRGLFVGCNVSFTRKLSHCRLVGGKGISRAFGPRPSGRLRHTTAFCAACGSSGKPPIWNTGFEQIARSHKRKKAPRGDLFTFGGEGGIRTFGVFHLLNTLQRHRVHIVSFSYQ